MAHAMGVRYAFYYRDGRMMAEDFTDFLVGAAIKGQRRRPQAHQPLLRVGSGTAQKPVWQTIFERWRRSFRF